MESFQITGKGKDHHTFDAIVIGSGITGGLAAKELTEAGLKVLLLERGKMIEHVKDYKYGNTHPWEIPLRNQVSLQEQQNYPIQKTLYLFGEDTKDYLVKDVDVPYHQDKPFAWYRGNQVGGRSLLWAKHCFRYSNYDFEANAKDGIGIDWPIRYQDIAPWYDHIEKYVGISGNQDKIPQLPDGIFLPPFEMNAFEKYLKNKIKDSFPERDLIISRMAVLTKAHNGRGRCQSRNLCHRGCIFGAYYSSNSVSIPDALRTGNLTLKPDSIVSKITYNGENNRARGVVVIDAVTRDTTEYYGKLIFLNASTLGSTQILLQSANEHFPDGLANSSGVLGHYLMDHHAGIGAVGGYTGLQESYYHGRRPASVYVPRFRNVTSNDQPYLRGFTFENYTSRADWTRGFHQPGIGVEWKESLTKPGHWSAYFEAYGETLPDINNTITLHPTKTDAWGLPILSISMEYGENAKMMREDMQATAVEMLDACELEGVRPFNNNPPPGSIIHEMGTARMGNDPDESVLNKWNQSHDIPNVFITDGSCMVSSPPQNPSLTYMALTARACNYAASALKRGEI